MLRPPERVRQQRDHSERDASGRENKIIIIKKKQQTVKREEIHRGKKNIGKQSLSET